jgi:hypothetical protein
MHELMSLRDVRINMLKFYRTVCLLAVLVDVSSLTLATRHRTHAWKMLYAVCTEITS